MFQPSLIQTEVLLYPGYPMVYHGLTHQMVFGILQELQMLLPGYILSELMPMMANAQVTLTLSLQSGRKMP
jgi:hypothetical protein